MEVMFLKFNQPELDHLLFFSLHRWLLTANVKVYQ